MKTRHILLAAVLVSAFNLQPFSPSTRAATRNAMSKINRSTQNNLNKSNQMAKRNTDKNNADGEIPANIEEDWYLEFTPACIRAGGVDVDTLWGASLALGYRMTQYDKIQLEIGYYQSPNLSTPAAYTENFTYDGTVAGQPVLNAVPASMKVTATKKTGPVKMIPVLLTYSFCLWLDSPGRFEVRVTPATGLVDVTNSSWSIENITGTYTAPAQTVMTNACSPDGSYTAANISPDGSTITRNGAAIRGPGSSNNIAFALGAGLGLTCKFSSRAYADIGYRYLWTTKVHNAPASGWNGTTAWNGMNLNFYTLTLGWKF